MHTYRNLYIHIYTYVYICINIYIYVHIYKYITICTYVSYIFTWAGGEASQAQRENLRAAALANAQALREITVTSPGAAALTARS